MEQTQFATDSLRDTVTTVDAMKSAAAEMKSQYKKLNIDEIEVSFCRIWVGWLLFRLLGAGSALRHGRHARPSE